MKGRIYGGIVLALVCLASIGLIFVFDTQEAYQIVSTEGKIVYYTCKILAILMLVAVMAYAFLRKNQRNLPILMYGLAVLYQFLPLGIRFLSIGENPNIIVSWLLVSFVTILFIGVMLAFEFISSKDGTKSSE